MIIPKIERLFAKDWEIFKALRLKSLTLHPDVFSPSVDEFSRTDDEWLSALNNPKFQGFVLKYENQPIGLTGVIEDRDYLEGNCGLLVMSFIEPEYRRLGYSKYFYTARIEWAKDHSSYKKLSVGHREGNEASRRANQNAGFQLVDVVDWLWPDGSRDKLYKYELEIR